MCAVSATDDTPAAGRVLTVGGRDGLHATIQAAVKAARPGDTVLVRGGVYRESVTFPLGGEPGRPITLAAAPGHIVLITTSSPLEGRPEPVEGRPAVYRWGGVTLGRGPQDAGVWEASSHLRLAHAASLDECERRLGSWYADAEAKALFIRPGGGMPAPEQEYVVEGMLPAVEVAQPWIVLDGVQAAFSLHGALIHKKAANVVARNGRFFCNRVAGLHVTGNDHVIEDNELFRNNHYGIQCRYGVNRAAIRRNLSYYNGPNNGEGTGTSVCADISLYGHSDYVAVEDNVMDGLHQNTFRTKTTGPGIRTIVFRRNVVRGFFDSSGSTRVTDNTILVNGIASRYGFFPQRVNPLYGGNVEAVDPGGELRRANLFHPVFEKEDPLFADPAWRDFRLQRGSPYEGRGAFPARAAVIYADPANGRDENDGRSAAQAFRTLARALSALHPDCTLYLLPGRYDEPLTLPLGGLSAADPVRVRAWGRSSDVVLAGGAVAEKVRHAVFEGLTFQGKGAALAQSRDIRFRYCAFADLDTAVAASEVETLRLDHVTATGVKTGVRLAASRDVAVTNSLFVRTEAVLETDGPTGAAAYSDHNVYDSFLAGTGTGALDLGAWRERTGQDLHSRILPVEVDERYGLAASSPARFAAADRTFAGARPPRAVEALGIRDLRAAPAPTSVSLLWRTPGGATESRVEVKPVGGGDSVSVSPVTTFQVLGEYFDNTCRLSAFFTTDRHAAVSGLAAGREYEAAVTAYNPEYTASHTETLRFRTPTELPADRTFYVSPQGEDAADGATEKTAWRTLARAASGAGPGDRVIVLPGVYGEMLRPRVSGTEGRPVIFESARPGEAAIDLMQSLRAAIEIANVDHVHVIGFRLTGGVFPGGDNVSIINARGIRISQCRVDFPRGSSFAKLKLGHGGLVAVDAPGLMVDNNVFLCGYVGVAVSASPGARVVNNTILGEGNYGIVVIPGRDGEHYEVLNNLFYRAIMGYKTGPQIWMMNAVGDLRCDHNLFHIPPGFKSTLGKLPGTDRIQSLEEWQRTTGLDKHSLCAEPVFLAPDKGDFRLAPGSPGLTLADDGGPVGARSAWELP